MTTFGPYPARVVSVHDGDTITLDVDLGFGVMLMGTTFDGKPMLSCRVWGINAPELRTTEGDAARDYARALLKPGNLVTIISHSWDKYGGRWDGEIRLGDGTDFATSMLAAGQARPYHVGT